MGIDDRERRQGISKMSSTEQAPEPTMDEILASIRKIISDDETGGDAQPEVAEAESAAAEPAAGDGLVDDLANALNDVQAAEEKSAEQPPEDILDLTQVFSDQPAEDASPETAAAPVDAAMSVDAAMPEVAAIPEAAVAPEAAVVEEAPAEPEASAEPATPAATDAQADKSDITSLLAEAGVQDMADEAEAAPQEAAAPAGEELNAAIEQDDTALADPAPAGEASISDALAALDNPAAETAPADTVPDEAAQAQDAAFDADLVTSGEPAAQALDESGEASAPEMTEQVPETPAPAPAAESFSEVEANTESDAQMPEDSAEEAQADVALSEPEAPVIDEPVEAAAALAGALEGLAPAEEAPAGLEDEASEEAEGSVEADSLLEAEAPAETEATAEAETTAEAEETVAEEADSASESKVTAASGDVRTLEDSVKDLLRPMLREWLDDNMERIVQDEVASANLKSSDG